MTTINTFDRVIKSVRTLPEISQDFILHEVTKKVTDLNTTMLTSKQSTIVKERMSTKREYASAKQVQDVMQKYSTSI